MIDQRETAAVIALVQRGDRPWHHYADLIESAGSALAIVQGDYEPSPYDPPRLFDDGRLTPSDELDSITAEVERWRAEGIRVVTILDSDYPTNLRSIHNRPPFLTVRGALAHEDARAIAIVGTREPSSEGLRVANAISRAVSEGFTVISGLAQGIDTAAHEAALARGHRTIAVLGTGLRRTYPEKNAQLQERIGREGALVSQFRPDAPPTRRTFPLRNILMSGLALATLVIEASNTSGARMQARFALEHGRPVLLMKSLLRYEWAERYAGRPGTFVVESAQDVIETIERLTSLDALTV